MFKDLDPLLHSQLRLAIISLLVSNGKSDFGELKKLTSATSGNISIQLKKLEEAGYVILRKGFLNNYQHTSVESTEYGINAFENYVKAIRRYLHAGWE